MIGFVAGAAVFVALFFAAAYEPRTRPPRPEFRPLCPCPQGCGRPAGQHVEPYARWLTEAAPSPVIRIPGQHRRAES